MRVLLAVLLATSGCSLLLDSGDELCRNGACAGRRDGGFGGGDGAVGAINPAGVATAESEATTSSLSFPYTVTGPGQVLIVGAALADDAEDFDAVTYGATELTQEASFNSGDLVIELWYLVDPPVGTADVTLDASASCYLVGGALSFTGVDLANPIASSVQLAGQADGMAADVDSASGDVVVAMFGTYDTSDVFGSLELGGGFDEQFRIDHASETLRLSGSIRVGAPGLTFSATMSGNPDYGLIALPLHRAP